MAEGDNGGQPPAEPKTEPQPDPETLKAWQAAGKIFQDAKAVADPAVSNAEREKAKAEIAEIAKENPNGAEMAIGALARQAREATDPANSKPIEAALDAVVRAAPQEAKQLSDELKSEAAKYSADNPLRKDYEQEAKLADNALKSNRISELATEVAALPPGHDRTVEEQKLKKEVGKDVDAVIRVVNEKSAEVARLKDSDNPADKEKVAQDRAAMDLIIKDVKENSKHVAHAKPPGDTANVGNGPKPEAQAQGSGKADAIPEIVVIGHKGKPDIIEVATAVGALSDAKGGKDTASAQHDVDKLVAASPEAARKLAQEMKPVDPSSPHPEQQQAALDRLREDIKKSDIANIIKYAEQGDDKEVARLVSRDKDAAVAVMAEANTPAMHDKLAKVAEQLASMGVTGGHEVAAHSSPAAVATAQNKMPQKEVGGVG